jgi:hypothetical protein
MDRGNTPSVREQRNRKGKTVVSNIVGNDYSVFEYSDACGVGYAQQGRAPCINGKFCAGNAHIYVNSRCCIGRVLFFYAFNNQ